MIIKKANIVAFGGVKNKEIIFSDGLNIIYGENEAGKSTIQAFIKVWLYGFLSYKGKDYKLNERFKYTPASGTNISGELYVEFKNKEYIIKRTFGKTKKEDTSIIIDCITGSEVDYISKYEPGKFFLNINRSTFINTLFIGQLGVAVKREKEGEILDRISNSIGIEEGQVSIDSAFLKLENYKKSISNVRKNGELDILKERYSNLINEKYEGYKLSEQNINNEEKLIKLSSEKVSLNNELVNLDIYKKYLKKIKLKKEYEDIAKYFRKKEELKNEEKLINDLLAYNSEIINFGFIRDIREEYSMYMRLLKLSNEENTELKSKNEEYELLKKPLRQYEYIGTLPDNILNILERLKIKKEVLKEKVDINESIGNEISFLEYKEVEAKKLIGNAYKIKDYKEEISSLLNKYEEGLKELKYVIEGSNEVKANNNKTFNITLLGISIISVTIGIIINNKLFSVVLYFIALIIIISLVSIIYVSKRGNKVNKKLEIIKNNIGKIEAKLDLYLENLSLQDYAELFKRLRLYDDYLKLHEKINERLKEKLSQRELLQLDKALMEYEDIKDEINKYLEVAKLNSLDELIDEVNNYKIATRSFSNLEMEINNLKNTLDKTLEQLNVREVRIREKLNRIGFINIDISKLEDILIELEDKLNLREDIKKSLNSVEEAYSALTRGKDMELIKEELKDTISINFNFSYENEEQVDESIKNKNIRLVEVEKEIKDVENEIKNRFNGNRTIPEIEEEIKDVEVKISKNEKQLKASIIANKILNESYEEIRSNFGPILNKNVVKYFENFTDGKYKEVKVSDKYEMVILDENNILKSDVLSNGANDQLYLALRLAFIEMIFKNKDISIYLDDAFTQYDDNRLEKTMKYILNEKFRQYIIFTCQKREKNMVIKNNIKHKYINLSDKS